jgi:hypothetical protein
MKKIVVEFDADEAEELLANAARRGLTLADFLARLISGMIDLDVIPILMGDPGTGQDDVAL